jgi:hypothetical protein
LQFYIALLAFIPALIASSKGHSLGRWWVYGFLLLPIAFVHSLVLSNAAYGKACPFCAEKIRTEAIVCPHCQRDLPTLGPTERVEVLRGIELIAPPNEDDKARAAREEALSFLVPGSAVSFFDKDIDGRNFLGAQTPAGKWLSVLPPTANQARAVIVRGDYRATVESVSAGVARLTLEYTTKASA